MIEEIYSYVVADSVNMFRNIFKLTISWNIYYKAINTIEGSIYYTLVDICWHVVDNTIKGLK